MREASPLPRLASGLRRSSAVVTAAQSQAALSREQILSAPAASIAPGVTYRHVHSLTPAGEPWSIHVLEVDRGERSAVVRSVEGHDSQNQMQRELPSEMGGRVVQEGAEVLAVVNGDFDLPEPYLGIPVGLSVTSGRLWTSDRPGWPVLGLLASGKPIIAVPELRVELRAGKAKWMVSSANKPLTFPASDRSEERRVGKECRL